MQTKLTKDEQQYYFTKITWDAALRYSIKLTKGWLCRHKKLKNNYCIPFINLRDKPKPDFCIVTPSLHHTFASYFWPGISSTLPPILKLELCSSRINKIINKINGNFTAHDHRVALSSTVFMSNWNAGFCGGRKTRVPGKTPLASTLGIEPGPQWWKVSALTAVPSLLPHGRDFL